LHFGDVQFLFRACNLFPGYCRLELSSSFFIKTARRNFTPAGTTLRVDAFAKSSERRSLMRKLALGFAAGAVLLTAAVPAMAQVAFYAGPGGIGVGAPYYGPGYYDYYAGPGVYVAPGWRYHRWYRWHRWRRW
jgi:hypothetical protein